MSGSQKIKEMGEAGGKKIEEMLNKLPDAIAKLARALGKATGTPPPKVRKKLAEIRKSLQKIEAAL